MKPKRRKAIPKKLRAVVALRQGGLCACGCGGKLMPGFHMDHQPPLELRLWDEDAQDTVPPSNSVDHLFGMIPACHLRKTNRPLGPHTVLGSDRHAIDKGKRLRGETGNGQKRKINGRAFQKPGNFTPRPPKQLEDL